MIAADLLRRLRNDLPMPVTIAALGREGPPAKMSEGYFRFLCPHCGEMRATVNPRNNLAHCFCCQKNLNNIDLLITLGYDFRSAVALLERWLNQYQAQQAKENAPGRRRSDGGNKEERLLTPSRQRPTLPARMWRFSRPRSQPVSTRSCCSDRIDPRWSQPSRTTVLQNFQEFGKPALATPKSIQRLFWQRCVHNLVRHR